MKSSWFTAGKDHTGKTFSGSTLSGATLNRAVLDDTIFKNVTFERCVFDHVELDGATFVECIFKNCTFIECSLKKAYFRKCEILRADIQNSKLLRARFIETKLIKCIFADKTNLRDSVFEYCDLSESNFANSIFSPQKLAEVNLYGADLRWVQGGFGVDLSRSNLLKAKLSIRQVFRMDGHGQAKGGFFFPNLPRPIAPLVWEMIGVVKNDPYTVKVRNVYDREVKRLRLYIEDESPTKDGSNILFIKRGRDKLYLRAEA